MALTRAQLGQKQRLARKHNEALARARGCYGRTPRYWHHHCRRASHHNRVADRLKARADKLGGFDYVPLAAFSAAPQPHTEPSY